MVYRTTEQRLETCARFMVGLRRPAVVDALRPYGFSLEAVEDGWARLGRVVTAMPPETKTPAQLLAREIDALVRAWFPIAASSLGAHHPAVGEALFQGLHHEHPGAAALAMTTFLERVGAAGDGAAPYGAEGPRAVALLAARGITAQKLGRARDLIAELTRVSTRAAERRAHEEQQRRAVEHVWAWYLEWSTIARAAIKNRSLLAALGLYVRKTARAAEGAVLVRPSGEAAH